jgi:hypothetical protein
MIAEAPGPINFTMFLTLFGDKLNGTDPEEVIRNAFTCFDDKHSGTLPKVSLFIIRIISFSYTLYFELLPPDGMVAVLCHLCFRPATMQSEKSRINKIKWRGRGAKTC